MRPSFVLRVLSIEKEKIYFGECFFAILKDYGGTWHIVDYINYVYEFDALQQISLYIRRINCRSFVELCKMLFLTAGLKREDTLGGR